MDMYSFGLALGAAGLGVMGLSGFAHAHAGHHAATHHAGHHLAPARGHVRLGARQGGARGGASRAMWALLSPRPIFSLFVGFGATGMALRGTLHGAILFAVAVLGGLVLEFGVLAPLWNFLFRFESTPALTLESCIGDRAQAATNFDVDGHGLVAVELDGQIVQLLGSLRAKDRTAGVRVRAGDALTIDDVDVARNRCTVTPLGG